MAEREAVRALFVDSSGAVLLIRVVEPVSRQAVWVTPGGGRVDREEPIATLRREILEELGVTITDKPLVQPG